MGFLDRNLTAAALPPRKRLKTGSLTSGPSSPHSNSSIQPVKASIDFLLTDESGSESPSLNENGEESKPSQSKKKRELPSNMSSLNESDPTYVHSKQVNIYYYDFYFDPLEDTSY